MGIMKRCLLFPLVGAMVVMTSCTTMYDSSGRPVDVLTPEGAALAVVAAGVVGYALADEEPHGRRVHRRHGHGEYRYHRDRCRSGRAYARRYPYCY